MDQQQADDLYHAITGLVERCVSPLMREQELQREQIAVLNSRPAAPTPEELRSLIAEEVQKLLDSR